MPGLNPLPQNRDMITHILDTAWSPVAKFRLLSGGVSPNHLLENADEIVGQKACLACGNCIDACPVVLREYDKIDLQLHRTSLNLETLVEESCLRCYSCIKVCPQVDRPLKLLAARHRITEKLVHAWLAAAYLLTASTGILLNHFRNDWSTLFVTFDSVAHKTGAIMWLLAPVLFYYFDRYHFKRTINAVWVLKNKDLLWWKQAILALFGKQKRPFQGEYNTGQKTWYFVVFGAMLVLGTTGIVRWIWEDSLSKVALNTIIGIHFYTALAIDISFAFHFGRKLVIRLVKRTRQILRDSLPNEKEHKSLTIEPSMNKPQNSSVVIKG